MSGCRRGASSSASSSACSSPCRWASRSAGTGALRSFVDPLINFFRALPPIALIPLVIVYFGIGEAAKTAILFYASFFSGVIVMVEGIGQISPIYVRVARTLGASDAEIFAKVIVPLAVPHILTAVRVALGVAWATLVRLRADRRPAGPGCADPERVVVLPARHHLRRHRLHRPDRAGDGPAAASRDAPARRLAGPDRLRLACRTTPCRWSRR